MQQFKGKQQELRCQCRRLLAKVDSSSNTGIIEIKCPNCKKINIFKEGILQDGKINI